MHLFKLQKAKPAVVTMIPDYWKKSVGDSQCWHWLIIQGVKFSRRF